jgi:toxoflavin biosynthesis protein ToxD
MPDNQDRRPPEVAAAAEAALKGRPSPAVMAQVPAGEFVMGTSDAQVEKMLLKEEWAQDWYEKLLFRPEQPQHVVRTPAFSIAVHPVTNGEYHLFVMATGHRTPRFWIGFKYPQNTGDHPVTMVSWSDARAYCEWLGKEVGQPYRLPTEAEWEYAARSSDARIYPWGLEFDPWRCNTVESGKRTTTAIYTYSPGGDSPIGLTDMSGNVFEWTSSLLADYPYDPNDGREDAAQTGKRVVRGGAWYYSRKFARCASREAFIAGYTSSTIGFRLALGLG